MGDRLKEYLYVLPLSLIAGITPLIIHYKKLPLGKVAASYWIKDYNIDFFSYYKSLIFLAFILLTIISFYLYLNNDNNITKTFYYIPLITYLLMIIVSTIFSKAKLTSLIGFPDRYEGMPVLIGYILVVILAINLINSKKQIKFILTILLISAVIIGIIGLYQFFGHDLLQSDLVKRIILPVNNYQELMDKLDYRFQDRNIIYATFYNPNYAGSYFAILFMLTLVMYLFAGGRQNKILYGAINLLMFANWLGSLSRGGIAGVLFATFLLILLTKNIIIREWRSLIIITIGFILVFTGMDIASGGKLKREFLSLGDETRLALEGESPQFKGIDYKEKTLIFKTEQTELKISFTENKEPVLKDGEDNNLDYQVEKNEESPEHFKDIQIEDKKYNNFSLKLLDRESKKSQILKLYYNEKNMDFFIDEDKNFQVIGMRGNLYPPKEVESWGFKGKEKLGSARGYIWSRSLPLLKDTILKGYGPDTYALYFPQHDVIGKFKALSNPAKIVDKPHNLYLQIGINTGLISLLAVLTLFTVYFWRNFRLYWQSEYNSWFARAGIGVYSAIMAYIVTGLFNDSVVSVAPVFWTLLGMGIMLEIRLKRKNYLES